MSRVRMVCMLWRCLCSFPIQATAVKGGWLAANHICQLAADMSAELCSTLKTI